MIVLLVGAVGPDDVCPGRWSEDWLPPEVCLDEAEVEAVVTLESSGADLYTVTEDRPDGSPLQVGDVVWELGTGWVGVARRS